jgi:hypothetical protein
MFPPTLLKFLSEKVQRGEAFVQHVKMDHDFGGPDMRRNRVTIKFEVGISEEDFREAYNRCFDKPLPPGPISRFIELE